MSTDAKSVGSSYLERAAWIYKMKTQQHNMPFRVPFRLLKSVPFHWFGVLFYSLLCFCNFGAFFVRMNSPLFLLCDMKQKKILTSYAL